MLALKQVLRNCVLSAVRLVGSEIIDHVTGKPLGRVFFFPWRGKLYVIGLQAAVRPMFLPQNRLTYWKQTMGFTIHPPPDFPREKA